MSDTRTDIRWLALIGMTILAVYLCWTMLRPFVSLLVWSALLAILYYPAYRHVLRWVKRPWAAATLSLLLVIATVMLPVAFVTTAVVGEFTTLAAWAQQAITELRTDPATAARFEEWKRTASNYVDAAPDLTVATYFTSQQLVTSNPGLVRRFTEAMTESLSYAEAHPDEVRRVLSTYTQITADVAAKLTLPKWPAAINRQSVQTLADLAVSDGLMEKAPDINALLP